MVCPNCGSTSVSVQVVSETRLTEKHKSFLWWVFIGWWWIFVKWLVFTIPALIIKIFSHKKYKAETVQKSVCVCQNCGKTWQV